MTSFLRIPSNSAGRVQTTALVLISLLAVLVGVWLFNRLTPRPVSDVVAAPGTMPLKELMNYRVSHSAGGVVTLDLTSDQTLETTYSSKNSEDSLRNQRYVRLSSGEQWTLFEHNRHLITAVHLVLAPKPDSTTIRQLRSYGAEQESSRLVARIFEVVTRDTNGDRRLTRNDDKHMFVADSEGKRLHEIAVIKSMRGGIYSEDEAVHFAAELPGGGVQIFRFDIQGWKPLPAIALPKP